MHKEYDYIIVGAGLCGLILAQELVKQNKRVLVLEKGSFLNKLGKVRHAFHFYDRHALSRSRQGMIIYRTFGVGGTSVVGCGNAVELTQEEYSNIGINFQQEMADAKRQSYVRDQGLHIGPASTKIMGAANRLGYNMQPMPKFSITGNCASCGDCYLGCRFKTKWSSADTFSEIKEKIDLVTDFSARKVIVKNGKAVGIEGRDKKTKELKFFADKIILSAGGLGTPVILQNSGIEAGDNLFVDPFTVVYGSAKGFNQKKELLMSAVCAKFHKTEGLVMAPYVDNYYSFCSCVNLPRGFNVFRLNRLLGIMVKIADDNIGKVYHDGTIDKELTENDRAKLKKGNKMASQILIECGVRPKDIFIAQPRGAHPGGTAAIGKVVNKQLETQMKNLYVCDASVLPFAPGIPPMLSLIALTKWFGKDVEKGKTGTNLSHKEALVI